MPIACSSCLAKFFKEAIMQRVGMYFSVKPGMEGVYREKHQKVWPAVLEGIQEAGIRNYSIYMKDNELYSYFEVGNLDKTMTALAQDIENQKWQQFMAPYMSVSSGVSDGSTIYLDEVFYAPGFMKELAKFQRVGMYMRVRRGMETAYRDAHRNVWPVIYKQIEQVKMRNYSIFMRGCELFSYFEVEDLEEAMQTLVLDPENQRWQAAMAPMMDVSSGIGDGSTIFLEEVFHLD
jgi:L-rhamnose mutarotase